MHRKRSKHFLIKGYSVGHMVRLTLPEPKLFRTGIEALSKLITDAQFIISPEEGMKLIAMDPSNIAMVIWKILPSAFSEFDVPEETKIGVNMSQINPIVKRIKARDVVTFEIEENIMKIIITGAFKRTFTIPLLELGEREYPEPELEFKVKAEIDADVIAETVKDAKIIADALKITAEEDKITMLAEGELSKAIIELTRESPALVSLEVQEPSKASYSIDYLEKIVRTSKVSDILTLQFATDYPARFDFKALERMELTFILAPRLE